MPTATRRDPSPAIRWVWPAPPSNPTDARPAASAPSASAPVPAASTGIATASASPGTSSTTVISTARIRPMEGTGSNPSGTATARRCGASRSATIDTADLPGVRACARSRRRVDDKGLQRESPRAVRRSAPYTRKSQMPVQPVSTKAWWVVPPRASAGPSAADLVHRRGGLRARAGRRRPRGSRRARPGRAISSR